MDFIERIWGISLDGGNGTVESALLIAAMAVITVIALRSRSRRTIK